MPVLHRDNEGAHFSVLPEVGFTPVLDFTTLTIGDQDIYFIFNAQHDCHGGACQLVETVAHQDRELTSMTELIVEHSNFNRYFVNLHAHHNAWRLRKVLPRNLTAPAPYTTDRQKLHSEAAQELREKNPQKRAEAAARAKATRERKKKESER